MRTVFIMVVLAFNMFALSLVAGEKSTSPLPPEVHAEWNLDKAWRVRSGTRERICLNGLWRFRSEPSLAQPLIVLSCEFEDSALDGWRKESLRLGKWSAALDTKVKKSGNAAVVLDFNLPPTSNFSHFRRDNIVVKPQTKYHLKFALKLALKSGSIAFEVRDANSGETFFAKTKKMRGTAPWKTRELRFTTPATTKLISLVVRHYREKNAPLIGKIWLDNLTLREQREIATIAISPPTDDAWGFLKVPGSWAMSAFKTYWHPADPMRNNPKKMIYAWYEREVTVPRSWQGRKISVYFEKISTDAKLYCNGKPTSGTIDFMGGEVDITSLVKPGEKARLSVLLAARDPGEVLSALGVGGQRIQGWKPYKRVLAYKGIVGDVYLDCESSASPKIGSFLIMTSVKKKRISVRVDLKETGQGGAPAGLSLSFAIKDAGQTIKSFSSPIPAGKKQVTVMANWANPVLWEVGKPKLYSMTVSLRKGETTLAQSLPERFGFREFEIRGKFFYLNNVKINLRPACYQLFSPTWSSRVAMDRWLKKTRAEGHNFIYTACMDFPGRSGWVKHLLDAADETGMLMAITPPEINLFWDDLDKPATYKAWCKLVRRRLQRDWNHPSLVLWRTNMNLCYYNQDQNPLLLDGSQEPSPGSKQGQKFAAAAKSTAFIETLDPTRKTYSHAGGNAGNIYTLNNYLCWAQPQDLREWLTVWEKKGQKPLMMVEFDLPYPGSFSMNDPTSLWANEPLMSEYGAILLGEKSYALEDDDFVDFTDFAWDRKRNKWRSAYRYYTTAFSPILDQSSCIYYQAVLPAWRTAGISGGVNSFENTGRRLSKRTVKKGLRKMRVRLPNVPLATDWKTLQQPGFFPDIFTYAAGGRAGIDCNFDLGRPKEKEYVEETQRRQVMHDITQPIYAYIAGAGEDWAAQDHGFYAKETIKKSVVLINDLRQPVTFNVHWQGLVAGVVVQTGEATIEVAPAETAQVPLSFIAPAASQQAHGKIIATVTANGKTVPVKPFSVQVYPQRVPPVSNLKNWCLYDPVGTSLIALKKWGVALPLVTADQIPENTKVLVLGQGALRDGERPSFFKTLDTRLAGGIQVLCLAQTGEAFRKIFNLRSVVRSSRQVWLRDRLSPLVANLKNYELADWRGRTTLAPLDGPPRSAIESQRWKFVWRCSQRGTVASTLIEKPHTSSFRPILDGEFDLRYMALWEVLEGHGRMVFCQLDLVDRLGIDPAADKIMNNFISSMNSWQPATSRKISLATTSASASADFTPLQLPLALAPEQPATNGANKVMVLTRGMNVWLTQNATQLSTFIKTGGTLVAIGLSPPEAELLSQQTARSFTSKEVKGLSRNPLGKNVPEVFRGVSPAEIHWRERRDVSVVTAVAAPLGWCSETGVLASIPVGAGNIIWLSAQPSDFDPARRPDLIFTKVNTSRLLSLVFTNLGVKSRALWSSCLKTAPVQPIALPAVWRVRQDPEQVGTKQRWMNSEVDEKSAEWRNIQVPGMWGTVLTEWSDYDGDVWYRVRFKVPEAYRDIPLEFYASAIDDTDEAFLNGNKIGETTTKTPKWWSAPRHYPLPKNKLNYGEGENILVLRVTNLSRDGGIVGMAQIRSSIPREKQYPIRLYIDKRKPRDNPYAYHRW